MIDYLKRKLICEVIMRLARIKGEVSLAVIIIVAIVVGVGSVFVLKKEDNVVEEVSESIVEKQLGLPEGSIDFTPSSKES